MRRIVNVTTGTITDDPGYVKPDFTPPPPTPEETAAAIEDAISKSLDLSPRDRAWVRVIAELLQAQNPEMTVAESRAAIRQSFRQHLTAVWG